MTRPVDLRVLVERATPEEWTNSDEYGWVEAGGQIIAQTWGVEEEDFPNGPANRAAIAAIHNHAPALCALWEAALNIYECNVWYGDMLDDGDKARLIALRDALAALRRVGEGAA